MMPHHVPGNKTKEKNQRFHFKQRMLTRYGFEIYNTDIDKIIQIISKGESKVIRKQSRTFVVHQVPFNGKNIEVVYDKVRRTLVTVLPPKQGI